MASVKWRRAPYLAALAGATVWLAGTGPAQPPAKGKGDPAPPATLFYPTGEQGSSIAAVEFTGPAEVRVGEAYTYQLKVSNLSKTLSLHNVKVRQHVPKGMGIVKAEPAGKPEDAGHGHAGDHPEHGNAGPVTAFDVGQLSPGQSKTISVTAVGHEVGDLHACTMLSYEPALCAVVRVVKPVLEVTKEAPAGIDLCDPFKVRYVVRNPGQAAATGVTLKDDLAKGLKTADGKPAVEAQIGDLPAGQSKEVVVELAADGPGTFTSGAVATSGNQSFQSRATTTRATRVDLQVQVAAPDTANVGSPTGYAVTVRNRGDAVAQKTQLTVQAAGERVRVVHATPEGRRGDTLTYDLGDIGPNQEKKVVMSLQLGQGETRVTAVAQTACARNNNPGTRAEAAGRTVVTAVPALLLEVVDQNDPLRIGEETNYTIAVINQGQAPDQNVTVVADIPAELQIVKAEGATPAKVDGQRVTFEQVAELQPGKRVDWRVRVKAVKEGNLRTKVELNSKSLGTPVPDVEPTRTVK